MKNKTQFFIVSFFFLFAFNVNAGQLSDYEIKDAVSLTQLMINRTLNDGTQNPLFIMIGRGPAPVDTLLQYAGFDVLHVPLSIKPELQRLRLENKEIKFQKKIQDIFEQLFPISKINDFDKIVLFDYWSMGDTLQFMSHELSAYLSSLNKNKLRLDIMALVSRRPNISLILMNPDYKEFLAPKSTQEVELFLEQELCRYLKNQEPVLNYFLLSEKMPNSRSFSLLADPAFAKSMNNRSNVEYAPYLSTIFPFQIFTKLQDNENYLENRAHILDKTHIIKELQEKRGHTTERRILTDDDLKILDFWEFSRRIDAQEDERIIVHQNDKPSNPSPTSTSSEKPKEKAELIKSAIPSQGLTPEKTLCKKLLSFFFRSVPRNRVH
jgi:hypothetical protein